MRVRPIQLILLFMFVSFVPYAQPIYAQPQIGSGLDDTEVARQYVDWAQKAMDETRWKEALSALERAADFANVSSDLSYLLAVARLNGGQNRIKVIEALDMAIETNIWVSYNKAQALLLKAELLISMRNYTGALFCIDQVSETADSAMLRLMAFRGLANSGDVEAQARFRSLTLSAFDRYPRDPRPLRIFFEYARNRKPQASDLPSSDINLLELALRRLPFLLETDPDLAWLSAPFIRDTDTARRYVSSYRAGGLSNSENFKPEYDSIPPALNLGLISDIDAVEELFDPKRFVLVKNIIIDVYNLLRSEEGRNLFTQKLLSFSGVITSDEDRDGFIDSLADCNSGLIKEFHYDSNQAGLSKLVIKMDMNGIPVSGQFQVAGESSLYVYLIDWERYPSVKLIELVVDDKIQEIYEFRPADFQFAPIKFIELGGSQNLSGLAFPVLSDQFAVLTRRSLISFCSSLRRPSVEIDGAVETIYMERGVLLRVVETIDERQVSVTEFERGLPVVQHIDLDLDGRMETVRRFRRPPADYLWADFIDYRRLVASSESDWSGDGRHKTMEVYLPDGSVVYSWDMDGSGTMNYSEQEDGNQ